MAIKKFTGMEMLDWWKLYRAGNKKIEIMQMMKLTAEECTELGGEAYKIYGRGPREQKRVPVIEEEKNKTFTRPPAKYDNMQPEDYEKKYLNYTN